MFSSGFVAVELSPGGAEVASSGAIVVVQSLATLDMLSNTVVASVAVLVESDERNLKKRFSSESLFDRDRCTNKLWLEHRDLDKNNTVCRYQWGWTCLAGRGDSTPFLQDPLKQLRRGRRVGLLQQLFVGGEPNPSLKTHRNIQLKQECF